jgi:DNA repair protein RecO (recombination protein O)
MRTYSAEALILRTYRYGEADRIVVFLTEDRGKRRGMARNATASRRRFGAGLESLTEGLVQYVERESSELVRLDRIEPRHTMMSAAGPGASDDAARILGHAAYFAELLDEWAPEAQANPRLYRLGAAVARALATARGGAVDALARYFEYWLLKLEGVYPAFDRCPRCGQATFEAGAVCLPAERTFVCLACSMGGIRLSADAVGFLRSATGRSPAEVAVRAAPAGALRELEQAHGRLIAGHLERELRSARVVKELRLEP